eukprot:Opistho-1_new@105551
MPSLRPCADAFRGYDPEGTGFVTRDELQRMFTAYFHLSMDVVRDVVKALEEEMMAGFEDDGGKPVSAVFTAPIPRDGEPRHTRKRRSAAEEDEDYDGDAETMRRRSRQQQRSMDDADLPGPSHPAAQNGTDDLLYESSTGASIRERRDELSPRQLRRAAVRSRHSIEGESNSASLSSQPRALRTTLPRGGGRYEDDEPETPTRRNSWRRGETPPATPSRAHEDGFFLGRSATSSPTKRSRRGPHRSLSSRDESMWPVMEAMSQDAINEMVDKAFQAADADRDGRISLDEFRAWAIADPSMTAWFDGLGSVF